MTRDHPVLEKNWQRRWSYYLCTERSICAFYILIFCNNDALGELGPCKSYQKLGLDSVKGKQRKHNWPNIIMQPHDWYSGTKIGERLSETEEIG